MASILFTLLTFLSVVIILVLVHELGHFMMARFFGMKVQRFSIGFGKPMWSFFDKQGTEFAIAPIPLGGYVKLLDTREGDEVAPADLPFAFDRRPLYQRFAVILAGPLINVLFAVLCFWLVLTLDIKYVKPVVGLVVPASSAYFAGIKAGDEIVAIGGRETLHWPAVVMSLVSHYGATGFLTISVKRPNPYQPKLAPQIQEVKLNLQNWRLNPLKPNPLENLGIKPYRPVNIQLGTVLKWPPEMIQERKYSFFKALLVAIQDTYNFIAFNLLILYKMITGVISWQSLGGPLSIMEAAALAAKQGFVIYVNFLALLSISIAIINILPIPGLDGGQILFQLIELIRGKPVSVATQVLIFRLGLIALIILMIQVAINDFLRL